MTIPTCPECLRRHWPMDGCKWTGRPAVPVPCKECRAKGAEIVRLQKLIEVERETKRDLVEDHEFQLGQKDAEIAELRAEVIAFQTGSNAKPTAKDIERREKRNAWQREHQRKKLEAAKEAKQ